MRLNIDKEHKELKAHGNYAFPVLVSDERLSWFDTGEFPWHWHPEIELTIVLDGNMTYLVNDNEYILRAGEGLFCNTNVLHSGNITMRKTAVIYPLPFIRAFSMATHPVSCRVNIWKEFYKVRLCPPFILHRMCLWQREILERMEEIHHLRDKGPDSRELQMQIALMEIWLRIYEHADCPEGPEENGRGIRTHPYSYGIHAENIMGRR